MASNKLVAIKDFCISHEIETTFIRELHRHELIELVTIKRTYYIPAKQLPQAEQMVRLYRDLQINIEGIHSILHLLHKLEQKENEVQQLKNRLAFYSPHHI